MTSAAQIAANIANAQHSTGPTTFEGKARSAENARKFGFYSKQAVLLTDEDHFHFDCICETFEFDLCAPANLAENTNNAVRKTKICKHPLQQQHTCPLPGSNVTEP